LSSCASNGCADPTTKTRGAATATIITASHFFIELLPFHDRILSTRLSARHPFAIEIPSQ
jgi:hypothetical protein